MFKVQLISIRGNDSCGFLTREDDSRTSVFASIAEVQREVPALLRGLSSYWQVRVVSADAPDVPIRFGFRSGPNGTGERWTWRDA